MKNKKGFTMIELLIVIALISIILLLVMTSLTTQRKKARDSVRISDIQKIRLALDEYRLACGEFPQSLELAANNGCPPEVSLADFLPQIPKSPEYSSDSELFPTQGVDYFYAGLSTIPGGRCYEYHIATQLEYGADNNFTDGEQSQFLNADHDFAKFEGPTFTRACAGSDQDFANAENDSYGLYDFRSTQHDF